MKTLPLNPTEADIQRLARRRVGMKLGWLVHATVFILVNAGLWAINELTGGPRWSHWPLMGWGLGLAIHGLVVALALAGHDQMRQMTAREAERLRAQR